MGVTKMMAVDLGASGGKCFSGSFREGVFEMQEIHRFEHEGVSFFLPDRTARISERTVWDDTLIHRNIVLGLHAYRREVSGDLDALGIDTWGSDGHFLTADGDLLGKVYCYRDHRLDGMVDVVKSRMDARRIYELTGIHFQPFNISNQLHWFVTHRKELFLPGISFLPVPTLFTWYLGGEKKVDSTWASVTQLMDARRKEWSSEILKALQIPLEVMPDIVAPGSEVGMLSVLLAQDLKLNRAKLIAVGSHDTASAFAAAPVDKTEEALIISSGTWSLVGKLHPEPITSDAALKVNLSNEGGIGNVRCLKNCMGTWLVQELRRNWAVQDGKELPWDDVTRMAGEAKPFAFLIDPDHPGFFNPSNMDEAIRTFCKKTGQGDPVSRGAILRAVYESLAFKYRLVNQQICEVCNNRTRVVHIVGGGCKNKLLNQFTADAMGLPVLAGPVEATAVGNFMVQALGLRVISSLHEALPIIKSAFPIEEVRPRNSQAWEAEFDRFCRICRGEGVQNG